MKQPKVQLSIRLLESFGLLPVRNLSCCNFYGPNNSSITLWFSFSMSDAFFWPSPPVMQVTFREKGWTSLKSYDIQNKLYFLFQDIDSQLSAPVMLRIFVEELNDEGYATGNYSIILSFKNNFSKFSKTFILLQVNLLKQILP